jgi:uncharacterized protein (TIGR03437 family)
MERKRKLSIAKASVILVTIPVLLWAYEYGPDPGYCGVPNENGGASGTTCATTGCHVGSPNTSKGNVTVTFPSGLTYVPGVKQQLTVTISDPATTQVSWGFELTARVANTPSSMAGTFATADTNTQLVCSQTNLFIFQSATSTCPANEPLQYMEHSLTGWDGSRGHTGSYSYQFTWTPPATSVGNVTFYVAANAAATISPGATPNANDHIYSTTYTLTPAAAANAPVIDSTQVENAASFVQGVVAGSWLTIKGTNLSPVTDTWANAIVNGKLPTLLDGVSVMVGGLPAYVYYISPGQINVVTGSIGTGSVTVTVTNPAGTSPGVSATSLAEQPAFFEWPNNQPVATRNADGSYAVAPGTFAGATTVAAKPGDVLILWGTGFGPTTPAAPVGQQVPASSYPTATPLTVMIGATAATVYGAALSPGFAALYQVAIQVPTTLANGTYPIVATVNGASSPATVMLTVAQ